MKDFCIREGVSQPSFYLWKKKLAQEVLPTAFIPVTLEDASPEPIATIELPAGATTELPSSIRTEELTRIVAVVVSVTTIDINLVNRVLLQPHWQNEVDLKDF